MGFLDRLLGREEPQQYPQYTPAPQARPAAGQTAQAAQRTDDEIAVERYRYLLRTAPPETIEQVHEEAFTKLTPEQRQLLFQQLSENAPAGDQPRGDDPHSLAQSATRSELRQPGTLERSFNGGNRGGGMGFGSMVASSLLGTVAGYVIGSALVSAFLPDPSVDQAADSGDSGTGDSGTDASGDTGTDAGADGGVSADGGDWGGGSGDWGGGGDFGGDFGGGDFGGGFDF
ncbi:hypothetical protein N1031_08005 [Herbiconiux moechotypicola]|uniref:DUF1707 domain-containing protein n=1 Tax=Herbiconiux moechotypicola TaxID=637393 RepID=A0ABN3DI64_9MICO|nr:hypothetical protein [Herbiconiux moechotypicola]MCS5729703.1 hypothetical protein [Herbiconiux moechotypicola]